MSKEKPPRHVADHTKNIVIFFGSTASRRTKGKSKMRQDNREVRAEKWCQKTGKQPGWRNSGSG
eukprot:8814182-Pyramimonas_sp.AAC.1